MKNRYPGRSLNSCSTVWIYSMCLHTAIVVPRGCTNMGGAMPFKVQVGPPQISIHQGQTVLITEETGQINWPSDKGLYFFDTRVVSSWTVYANGEPWDLLNGDAISYDASRIFLTNGSLPTEEGTIPPRTLGFIISRWISGGMHEDLGITNNSQKAVKFQLEIAVRCDFANKPRSNCVGW